MCTTFDSLFKQRTSENNITTTEKLSISVNIEYKSSKSKTYQDLIAKTNQASQTNKGNISFLSVIDCLENNELPWLN